MRCIVVLTAVLAVIYAQAESKAVDHDLQQTLMASMTLSAAVTLKPVSGEVTEIQSRNKRTPILLGKALLGGAALGAGAFGVGLYKAKYITGGYNGYGYGYGYPKPDYHYHYHSYPPHNYYSHYHYHGPSYY